MRSLEQVNIRTNVRTYVRTYVLTYIRTGQTLYPLHNFVVRGDKNQALFSPKGKRKKIKCRLLQFLFGAVRVNCVGAHNE